MTDNCFI